MLKLKIREKGHTITLPGVASFRTPAEIDISNMSLHRLMTTLRSYNITNFEIISTVGDKKVVYTQDNVIKKKVKQLNKKTKIEKDGLDDRFSRIENLIKQSVRESNTNLDLEQINKKIDMLSQQLDGLQTGEKTIVKKEITETKKDDFDETETFIPQIDTEGMKLTSTTNHKTLKRDDDSEDAADLLSQLTKNGG